ncbi:hypothetical protein P5673_002588 [Acropora cervicornis]|uniref:Uncharacterized protein n=1 Tax=Acropora cervicornis TaxID=6130 RepID=A0AAD9R3E9_ACRCE|nr:hypothetical protein P5673_002588 [Acropora cervicornis]
MQTRSVDDKSLIKLFGWKLTHGLRLCCKRERYVQQLLTKIRCLGEV